MLFFWLPTINLTFAVSGLVLLAVSVVLLWDYFFNERALFIRWLQPYVWFVIIATTISGVLATLLYSEYFGYIPCSLCWLQRIALYPQALLSVVAWRAKDAVYYPLYGMALSSFGFLVAVYHYIYQHIPEETMSSGIVPCLADGSADCADRIMDVFGFVTYPFLSAVTFAFLFVLYLHLRKTALSADLDEEVATQ